RQMPCVCASQSSACIEYLVAACISPCLNASNERKAKSSPSFGRLFSTRKQCCALRKSFSSSRRVNALGSQEVLRNNSVEASLKQRTGYCYRIVSGNCSNKRCSV